MSEFINVKYISASADVLEQSEYGSKNYMWAPQACVGREMQQESS